jgi:hypothetical protein
MSRGIQHKTHYLETKTYDDGAKGCRAIGGFAERPAESSSDRIRRECLDREDAQKQPDQRVSLWYPMIGSYTLERVKAKCLLQNIVRHTKGLSQAVEISPR